MATKRKSVTVSVSRTIQLKQYHPVGITITETAEVPPDENYKDIELELYKSATKAVTKFLDNEIREHGEDE